MTEQCRQEIVNAYHNAGVNFLAYKLIRLFKPIENDTDRILHNDIVAEAAILIGVNVDTFLTITAKNILDISQMNQGNENGTQEEEFKR